MPRAAEAREWWAEVEDVRARIEQRRARESQKRRGAGAGVNGGGGVRAPTVTRRGVREIRAGRHLMVVRSGLDQGVSGAAGAARRRPRARMVQRVGPRPDRIAAWAVVLGFVLVLAAVLSAHG